MNQIKELHSFTTENSITLYWDKPEGLEVPLCEGSF